MTGVLLASALLLAAVALAVIPPLLGNEQRFAPSSPADRRRAALQTRREEIYLALRDMQPRIELDEELRLAAKRPLDRMLELS